MHRRIILILLLCLALPAPPAPGAPPALKPPAKKHNLTLEDRKEWFAILKWPRSCEEAYDTVGAFPESLTFWELEPGKYLVRITCARGAYNPVLTFMSYDETVSPPISSVLNFKTYYRDNGAVKTATEPEVMGWSAFNEKTKELVILAKIRGMGDCGKRAVYQIKNGQALLREFRAKFNCDGKEWIPEKALVIYRR